MQRTDLVDLLSREALKQQKRVTRLVVVLSVCFSTVVSSCIGAGVALWVTDNQRDDTIRGAVANCNIQRNSRIEGNKRVQYTQALAVLIEHFKPVREFLEIHHPELYPLPAIKTLPIPDCQLIHPAD